jgi:hypothetical protein
VAPTCIQGHDAEEQFRRHRPRSAHHGRIVVIALAATGTIGAWGWIGVVALLTGLVRFCPVYPPLGLSTRPARKA